MKIGRTSSRKHRKVYEHHYGKIPKDEYGRSCQIHHIDENWNNNNIDNLKNPGHISGLISNRNKSIKNWIIV